MKKLLSTLAVATALTTGAQAGAVIDFEVGGGMWNKSAPIGSIAGGGVTVDAAATLGLTASSGYYMWAVVDHLIPIIPNLRYEQSQDVFTSTTSTTFNILTYSVTAAANNKMDLTNQDVVLYWGLPFVTMIPWIEKVDFGLGAKLINGSISSDLVSPATNIFTVPVTLPLVYGYLNLRVEPPFVLGLGFEAELKYLSYTDAATNITIGVNEQIYKVDWGIEAPIPVIDLEVGVELGYKSSSIGAGDGSTFTFGMDYSGIFYGVFGKFGI